jgi:hypothetical protein
MGAPKNPRAKRPLKPKMTGRARDPSVNPLALQHQTPEGRAKFRLMLSTRKNKGGRPKGTPDGYSLKAITPIRAKAKEDAERIVKIMAVENQIDDIYAIEALKAAVEIMREPGQNRDRLTAARMVLDFTKTKPATKQDVTIGRAEEFLESLLVTVSEDDQEEQITDGKET